MTLTLPRSLYGRPLGLWFLIARTLLRHRWSYFLILPPFVGAGLAFGGAALWELLAASFTSMVLGWLLLTTHEYAHVALLLCESHGYSSVTIEITPGGWRMFLEHLRRYYAICASLARHAGVSMPGPRTAPVPTAGYFRVCSNMVLSSEAKARIALAGAVLPVLAWIGMAGAGMLLYAAGIHRGVAPAFAAVAGAGAYVVVHPIFSGLLYHGIAYSDLGYAAAYFGQCIDITRHDPLVCLAILTGSMLKRIPGLAADVVGYTLRPSRLAGADCVADKKPKRTCLSWIYKRDEQGQFTDRIVLLLPLGMALFQQLSKEPRGPARNIVERMASDKDKLQRLQSYRKVFLMELGELSSRAWELADGGHSFAEIVQILHESTGLASGDLEPGLREFFLRLHRGYILNMEWPEPPLRRYPQLADVVFDFGEFGALTKQLFTAA